MKSIQAAVAAAKAGSSILINNGTYEENEHVSESLVINAASSSTPVVDGSGRDSCFQVNGKGWIEVFPSRFKRQHQGQ